MKKSLSQQTVYKNARILDPANGIDIIGDLLIDGDKIKEVSSKISKKNNKDIANIIDASGLCIAPGIIDMRVQIREPGEEHKESIQSAGLAAVKGGVTSMVCLPNTKPVLDDQATIEYVTRRAGLEALSKLHVYGAATKGLEGKELAELGLLAEAGAVGFTDGILTISDAKIMYRVLSYASTFDLMVMQHPEDPSLAEGGVMNSGEMATRLGLAPIPREAEIIILERDMRLVEMTGGRYHASHISTSESVEIINEAKNKGLNVSCDTAPFYFTLNEIAVGDYRTFAKLSPPLRSEKDRKAIVDGLKSGVIDVIASDHAPQDQESKRLPFAQAAFGGSGLETLFAKSLDLFHNGDLSLLEVLSKLTSKPASLLRLQEGNLSQSSPADFIVFDPEKPWKIIGDNFISKSKNTPFDGHLAQGTIIKTVINGSTVFESEKE